MSSERPEGPDQSRETRGREPEGDYTDRDEQDVPAEPDAEPPGSYVDHDETSVAEGEPGGYTDHDGRSTTTGEPGGYTDRDE